MLKKKKEGAGRSNGGAKRRKEGARRRKGGVKRKKIVLGGGQEVLRENGD